MQKRSRYARFLVPLLVVSIAGCQLPSLLPKATPTVEVPTTTPLSVPGSTGNYSAKLAEIEELRRKYQTLGVTSEDVIIPGYTTWTGELPASSKLELLAARIEYPIVAGSAHCMVVSVNGKLLSLPLTNKGQVAHFRSGDKYPYFNSGGYPGLNAWLLMYSPDFNLNNSSSSGRYQVISDPGEAYRYVWDISSLVGSAATMSLQIHNNGVGVNKPIVVRLPKPSLRLEVDTPFFSPNQDGTLDTATGSIKAQGPWKLSVVNHGEITTGSGNSDLNWNGEVNGVKLPDGEYTLRLEDASNPSSKAEGKVVFDTVAPKIDDAYIYTIDTKLTEAGEAEFTYSVNASAVDQAVGGVSSDIDATSLEVSFPDAPFTSTGKSLKTEEGEYQAKYNLPSTSNKSPNKLRYTASIKDRAGNKSVDFNKNFSATIEREIQISYEPLVGVSAAGVRAMSANKADAIQPLKQGDVFYSQSGNIAQIECYDTWIPSDPKFKGGTATYLVTKVSNLFPDEVPTKISYDDTFKPYVQNKHVFRWNGKVNNSGDFATTGKYIVELAYKHGWIKVKDPKFEFKVCDISFIWPNQWKNMTPAKFSNITNKSDNNPLQQAAHILDGHILDGVANPDELFSSYFPTLMIPRPGGYSEKSDQKRGYEKTEELLRNAGNRDIYDEVRQIAKAVWVYGDLMSKNDTVTRDAAILYDNGKVRWIRAVSIDYGGVFHTVYPNWKFQETFEKGI